MLNREYPLYNHTYINSFHGLLMGCKNSNPEGIAFQYTDNKKMVSVTYGDFLRDVLALASYIEEQGFKNTKIAVLGENSYFWILSYFAVVISSNIIVPIDKELSEDEIGILLRQCETEILVHSGIYDDIASILKGKEYIKRNLNIKDIPEVLLKYRSIHDDIQEFVTDENAVCSIIYTSGTTGKPKGVMLTQKSLMIDAVSACKNVWIKGTSMLTLPLHHTFAFTTSVLAMLVYRVPICINKNLRSFTSDILKYKPQNMFLVPLYVETIYKNIWKKAKEQKKDRILKVLVAISSFLLNCGVDLRRVFFKSILDQFGGNLDLIVTGGAAIDQRYIDGLTNIGIQVLNGYGITECSPVVAVNRNKYSRAGSVGLPLSDCDVSVIDNEICVRGEIVMKGYYEDDVSTKESFTDGWFRTGDLGYIDSDGFVFITGRKKNLIILSNGKNVSPEELEERLLHIEGVLEVVVSEKNGMIEAEIYSENHAGIKESIDNLNKELPNYKRIQKVVFRENAFAKTTTQKIKRQ